MDETTEIIWKYALKNAAEHEGKADKGAIAGKLLMIKPEVKKEMKEAMKKIDEVVKEVNRMKLKEQTEKLKEFEGRFEIEKRVQREGLKPLEFFEGGKEFCRTRIAPNPNGPLHLGHVRQAYLSHTYARMYRGEFLLRFDDTDPKVKKPVPGAYEKLLEDLEWLGFKPDRIFYASDRFEVYYEYMKKIVQKEGAYVCTCEQKAWQKMKAEKQACPCRANSVDENLKRLEKMLSHEYKQGEAVLVIKTDLEHEDPSVRDWIAARIIDKPAHPRISSDYKVWPTYNFNSAIDDHEFGITLITRGQEHSQNTQKQKYLYDYFGWIYPQTIHTGRVAFGGGMMSKSQLAKALADGLIKGWDDPRLATMRAFRRRGITPEAVIKIMEQIGAKTSDTHIKQEMLYAFNRELLRDKTKHFIFLQEPVKLDVSYCPEIRVGLKAHPDIPELGVKEYNLKKGSETFYVSMFELNKYGLGSVFRLKETYNVRITDKRDLEAFAEFVGTAITDKPVMFWLKDHDTLSVLMPDGKKIVGAVEGYLRKMCRENEVVYLEKFGYCKIERIKNDVIECIFTHE